MKRFFLSIICFSMFCIAAHSYGKNPTDDLKFLAGHWVNIYNSPDVKTCILKDVCFCSYFDFVQHKNGQIFAMGNESEHIGRSFSGVVHSVDVEGVVEIEKDPVTGAKRLIIKDLGGGALSITKVSDTKIIINEEKGRFGNGYIIKSTFIKDNQDCLNIVGQYYDSTD